MGVVMAEMLLVLSNVFTLLFVVSSMLALGLSLTVKQILEPLKDAKLVVLALVANFVLVPALALGLWAVIPMDESFGTGLVLLACAAGAPFLPKLVQLAKGDVPFGVGLMVMLMVVTVAFMPLVLPLLLPGVTVNPMDIASSLVVMMLIPLGVGLALRARYPELAASLQPGFDQTAGLALKALLVAMLLLNWRTLLGTIGSGAILAAVLLVVGAFAVGYLLGPAPSGRTVLALGTAQRNVAAAMVVASGNFADDPNVMEMVLVGSVLMLALLLPGSSEIGRRAGLV